MPQAHLASQRQGARHNFPYLRYFVSWKEPLTVNRRLLFDAARRTLKPAGAQFQLAGRKVRGAAIYSKCVSALVWARGVGDDAVYFFVGLNLWLDRRDADAWRVVPIGAGITGKLDCTGRTRMDNRWRVRLGRLGHWSHCRARCHRDFAVPGAAQRSNRYALLDANRSLNHGSASSDPINQISYKIYSCICNEYEG